MLSIIFINYQSNDSEFMRNKVVWIIPLLYLISLFEGMAQEKNQQMYPGLFASSEVLKMSLYFDITTHVRKKSEEYCPGRVVFYDYGNDSITLNVRCRARGNNRKDNCFFPPVMLNFKPDTLHTNEGYVTKLKLVTHCVNSKTYREYLLEEFLIYKLWEIISPYAFRTRLVDVSYFDTGEREKHYNATGFFIEPLHIMTKRTNTLEIKGEYFHEAVINALDADRVAFFCYMIGNTDWRIKSGHNIKFIKLNEAGREEITAIPYDFDHAGLVNAAYAMPSPWSSAEAVIERDFIGRCRDYDDNYYALIDEFNSAKEQIYETILNYEHLEMKKRKQIYKYVASFYSEMKKPDSFVKKLHSDCMDRY